MSASWPFLTDLAYAKLLTRLSKRKFDRIFAQLRENIPRFYSNLSAPIETQKNNVHWQNTLPARDELKSMTPAPAHGGGPAY